MMIQEEKWKNVKFSKKFQCSYSLCDNQILIIEGRGFSSLADETDSVLFGHNIIDSYLPADKPYVMVQNWQNYKNSSAEARRYFITSVINDKRLMAIVFCNFTKRQLMSIRLGRALNILTCPVKISRNREEALQMARSLIHSHSDGIKPSAYSRLGSFFSGMGRHHHINRYVYDLLEYLESINREPGISESSCPIEPDHPMLPVFDMITLIKSKLKLIEEERDRIEYELIRSKEKLEETVQERTGKLQESEKLSREILDFSPVSIAIMDSDYIVRYINNKMTDTFGYTLSDISTFEKITGFINDADEQGKTAMRKTFKSLMNSGGENRHFGPVEVLLNGHDGRQFNTDVTISRIGSRLLISVLDMTQKRADSLKLRRLTLTDELTGLNNRRHYRHVLQSEFDRSKRYSLKLSLILFDIDYFKNINDNYGHPAGDEVLIELARRSQAVFRGIDQVFRTGGEEFAVILPETDIPEALVASRRFLNDISGVPFKAGPYETGITVSLGLTSLKPDTGSIDEFISATDRKMYEAKQNGRNRIEYD